MFSLRNHLWGMLLLAIGLYTVVVAGLGWFSRIPGDMGDARFNMFVLEHFFRFVTGQTPSFWDAPIFYPYPLTTAFTANHLGAAPVYAVFRLTGFDRETAFQLWYVAGHFANFASAYFVLRRARFGDAAAALGAFIFAFGLPALAQQNHVQLLWRAGVPLASWWMWRFTQFGKPHLLFLAALAAVWQLYVEIYMGVMLVFLLLALLVAGGFVLPGRMKSTGVYWRGIAANLIRVKALPWVAGIILLAVAAVMLMLPYGEVTQRYGFTREIAEVKLMLPQWRSYLLSDQSVLWSGVSSKIQGLHLRWEHQLFLGIGPVILVALAFFLRPPAPQHRYVRASRIALIAIAVLTFHVQNVSLYELVLQIPGLTAIRGVARIIEVLLWPVAVLAASSTTVLLTQKKRALLSAAVGALAGLTCFESATSKQFQFPKADAQARAARLRAEIAAAPQPSDKPILFVASRAGEPPMLTELDAMLAAQEKGWATLNGYSGNAPPGYAPTTNCSDARKRIEGFTQGEFAPSGMDAQALIHRVLPVGFSGCGTGPA